MPAQAVAVGIAAVGVTLVLGAAGVMQATGTGDDPEMSAAAAGGQAPSGATTPELAATGPGSGTTPAGPGGARMAHGTADLREEGTIGDMASGAIPGVGDLMMSQIPASTRQVIVVTAADRAVTENRVTRWERTGEDAPWRAVGAEIPGRNGANGWTDSHVEGDQRSPVGVYSLTAAGGRFADPGTALPYEYRPSFYQAGSYDGDPMGEAFNYVVAIDYNRLPGHPPSDPTRPLGASAGGDIWLHVDHGTPTRGCVSISQASMEAVLHWLTPSGHPMIIMGDRATLEASSGQ